MTEPWGGVCDGLGLPDFPIDKLEKSITFATPEWLGIDEIHIIGKPRCVIRNIEHNKVVNLMEDRNKPTVLNYLSKLPNRTSIKCFDHPVTNAYTESLNNLIRVVNRIGRGYSFEALRAKILYTKGAHQIIELRPKAKRREADGWAKMTFSYTEPDVQTINYGVDISHC